MLSVLPKMVWVQTQPSAVVPFLLLPYVYPYVQPSVIVPILLLPYVYPYVYACFTFQNAKI